MGRSWFLVALVLAIASSAPREVLAQARSMVCSPDQAELEWDPQAREPRCMVETVVKGEDPTGSSEESRKKSRDACFQSCRWPGRASSAASVACHAIGMLYVENTAEHVDYCRVTSHPPQGKGGFIECACPVIGYCRPKKTKKDGSSSSPSQDGWQPAAGGGPVAWSFREARDQDGGSIADFRVVNGATDRVVLIARRIVMTCSDGSSVTQTPDVRIELGAGEERTLRGARPGCGVGVTVKHVAFDFDVVETGDEAKRRAEEEAKKKAEAEAKRKADEEAKKRADDEAKRKADEDAKKQADAKKADAEARRKRRDDQRARRAALAEQRRRDREADRQRREQAHRERAAGRVAASASFQSTQTSYVGGAGQAMLGVKKSNYKGPSWRLMLTAGAGMISAPLVENTNRNGTQIAEASSATAPTILARVDAWPLFSRPFGFAVTGSAGVGYFGAGTGTAFGAWLDGGGKARLGLGRLGLLASASTGYRSHSATTDIFVAGASSVGYGESNYGYLRYGGGVQLCFRGAGGEDRHCMFAVELEGLIERPKFTTFKDVYVARLTMWMNKGAMLSVEWGWQYPRQLGSDFPLEASTELVGNYLNFMFGFNLNLFGSPYGGASRPPDRGVDPAREDGYAPAREDDHAPVHDDADPDDDGGDLEPEVEP